ncbi:DUF4136 domain-containing protein [Mucilaginibacter sp. 14171R-50]|uniref:DUF4136 domain-containing protein n=1 Tax=Mucilaginibacter sp. 14171R-50 TaxID=2703789 RepID=UPI00138B492F|nr:DUF4136 domain-containing protein [Mucilaginibacter sp. 14171R-50]QHS55344.1 DUF4136 domain-containing protein [Mucilaginibacter sp. 14171R-50]
MKNFKSVIVLLAATFIVACSGYQYYAIQSSKASFNKYRTFAWLPVPDTPGHVSDLVDEKIKEAVTAGLEKRGLALQSARPDLLVRYSVQVKDRTRIYNYPTYVYGPGIAYRGVTRDRNGRYFYYNFNRPFPVFVANDIVEMPYSEGTLIIDLIERRNHQVIWRGYGSGDVDDRQRAIQDIPEGVEGILNKMPIAPVHK